MKQTNSLEQLFRDGRNTADHPWLANWTAPFAHSIGFMGGELHPVGAEELWGLAYRLRQRFPQPAGQEYLPKRFPVVSTQVACTAASASAFTGGFFPDVPSPDPEDDAPNVNPAHEAPPGEGEGDGAGGLGARREMSSVLRSSASALDPLHPHAPLHPSRRAVPGRGARRPQAVAVFKAPKEADPLLRFFDCSPAYAQHDEDTEQCISGWMQGNGSRLVPALEARLGLSRPMSPCEVEGLWQLCLLEAGLHGEAGRACRLFKPEEVLMLEWVDDVHLLETQAWGAPINYQIAAPLLRDAVASLTAAANGKRRPRCLVLNALSQAHAAPRTLRPAGCCSRTARRWCRWPPCWGCSARRSRCRPTRPPSKWRPAWRRRRRSATCGRWTPRRTSTCGCRGCSSGATPSSPARTPTPATRGGPS